MTRFAIRKFAAGDEDEINRLYRQITGRSRSVSQYNWQWKLSPSGPGDVWLITDSHEGGRIIGHHGVMPIRFTNGADDLLFGKIENTMVLPSYRDKIVYPRYELRFKLEYEDRYHALFATTGPENAIRVRKAVGYEFPVAWRKCILSTSRLSCLKFFVSVPQLALNKCLKIGNNNKGRTRRLAISDGLLSPELASKHEFFDNFWNIARRNHEISPRRDRADLQWRFWDNQYKEYFTFILDDQECKGYAIISSDHDLVRVEDYAVEHPEPRAYEILFKRLADVLRKNNISFYGLSITNDSNIQIALAKVLKKDLLEGWPFKNYLEKETAHMPRLITKDGKNIGLPVTGWHITGIIFEGR